MNPGGISARALAYWQTRQAAAANNLANTSTPGFKAERVFARALRDASIDAGSGTDFSPGAVNPTGRPLDVAIVGDAYLVVAGENGERWLRGGALALDSEGRLVDPAGRPVLGDHGTFVLPPGEVEITATGEVLVDGVEQGRLRLERPRGGSEALEREGANLWVPTDGAQKLEPGSVRIRQGHLEESNVDPIRAMVEMIEIQRAYTAVQRSLITEDGVMETLANDIGRVAG